MIEYPTEQQIKEAMQAIESKPEYSLHHWSRELDIPVGVLQVEWAKHVHQKRMKDACK